MRIWWITLVSVSIFCFFARIYSHKIVSVENEIFEYKPNKYFSLCGCIILILVSGLRANIGDTTTYINHFEMMSNNFIDTLLTLDKEQADIGFKLLSVFIKDYITENSQIYIFILAAITIILIFTTLYKYCNILELGIFLFITAGNYLVSMNGVRQYIVSAILFYVFPLIYKKKWYLYFSIVLSLSTIHKSAIIFIPVYFIANAQAWGKVSKILLGIGIMAYIFYPITAKMVNLIIQDTQYSVYGEGIMTGSSGSSNIMRSLVYLVPLILSYINKNKISKNEKYFNIIVNMSILNFIFMLLSSTASWIFARYCMYFSLYMIVLLCWCIKYILNIKLRRLMYYSCTVLFLIYYYYEMHISLKQIYMSNFINL